MKINELKVGDKIKYFELDAYGNRFECISNIRDVRSTHVVTDDNIVYHDKIISKIETVKNEKEIFIDLELLSEPKNSQFISYCNGCQRTFVINKKIGLNNIFVCDNCLQVIERVIKRLKNYEK